MTLKIDIGCQHLSLHNFMIIFVVQVSGLRSILKSKGASTVGNKGVLIKRLNNLMDVDETKGRVVFMTRSVWSMPASDVMCFFVFHKSKFCAILRSKYW